MANVQQHHHVTGWTGWVGFAGMLMGISGLAHILFGVGGIFSQDWYTYAAGDVYVFDASQWGWAMVVGGVLLILSAMLLLSGNMLGRIVGGLLALGSLLANLALFAVAPVWSAIAIVLSAMVLYAIIAHGKEMKHLGDEH